MRHQHLCLSVSLPFTHSLRRSLSLAFNDLRSLDDLAQCAELRELNVMHNKLRALRGLESMRNLDVLKASKNRISDLAACVALCCVWPSEPARGRV